MLKALLTSFYQKHTQEIHFSACHPVLLEKKSPLVLLMVQNAPQNKCLSKLVQRSEWELGCLSLSDEQAEPHNLFPFLLKETLSQTWYLVFEKISVSMIKIFPSSFHILTVCFYLLHLLVNPLKNVSGTVKAKMCFKGKAWLRKPDQYDIWCWQMII